MSEHLVFVYGTLRRGGVRAMPDLFPGARFVGGGSVRGRLYDLGEYPGLLLDEAGSAVTGEVYEVDDEILRQLDEIEATTFYSRRQVGASLDDGRRACWVYVYDAESHPGRTLIASGDWIEYARAKAGAG